MKRPIADPEREGWRELLDSMVKGLRADEETSAVSEREKCFLEGKNDTRTLELLDMLDGLQRLSDLFKDLSWLVDSMPSGIIRQDRQGITIKGWYHIGWEDVDTPDKIESMGYHLIEKKWMKERIFALWLVAVRSRWYAERKTIDNEY